jgi:hypothetical protein
MNKFKIYNLYSSSNIIRVIKSRRMRWARYVARMGRGEASAGFWSDKPEGKRPFVRPMRRWEVNIKMDLQEVWCGGVDWIELAQDRDRWGALVDVLMNLRVS